MRKIEWFVNSEVISKNKCMGIELFHLSGCCKNSGHTYKAIDETGCVELYKTDIVRLLKKIQNDDI